MLNGELRVQKQIDRLPFGLRQELLPDAIPELREYLSYPLEETLAADASAEVVADDFRQVADAVLAAYDSGALAEAAREGNAAFKVLRFVFLSMRESSEPHLQLSHNVLKRCMTNGGDMHRTWAAGA